MSLYFPPKPWIHLKLDLLKLWEESYSHVSLQAGTYTPHCTSSFVLVRFWVNLVSNMFGSHFICRSDYMQKRFTGLLLLSGLPQVLCFRTLRRHWNECSLIHTHTHTQAHTQARTHTEGSSLLPLQTSKLAVPRGTSNAWEAIKRQKLFSVRS